jgi:hypothetical protein
LQFVFVLSSELIENSPTSPCADATFDDGSGLRNSFTTSLDFLLRPLRSLCTLNSQGSLCSFPQTAPDEQAFCVALNHHSRSMTLHGKTD